VAEKKPRKLNLSKVLKKKTGADDEKAGGKSPRQWSKTTDITKSDSTSKPSGLKLKLNLNKSKENSDTE
jgi:hypothetical protein